MIGVRHLFPAILGEKRLPVTQSGRQRVGAMQKRSEAE